MFRYELVLFVLSKLFIIIEKGPTGCCLKMAIDISMFLWYTHTHTHTNYVFGIFKCCCCFVLQLNMCLVAL